MRCGLKRSASLDWIGEPPAFPGKTGQNARELRKTASLQVDGILANPSIIVIPQSGHSFEKGFALDQALLDKEYSLTDCISMEAMRQEGITELLTHDVHSSQEGVTILL